MASLESRSSLEQNKEPQALETKEIARADLEQAKEKQQKTTETIHSTLDPLITPYEVSQLKGTLDRFKTIETSNDTAKLKEELGKDPDLKLANIPAGSRILTVFQGGPESLTIKHLNDKVLGVQGTNEFIAKRQENILQSMQNLGLASADNRLSATYKLDKFQINDEQLQQAKEKLQKDLAPEELQKLQLSTDPETANQQVIDYVLKQAEQKSRSELGDKIGLKAAHIQEQLTHVESRTPLDEHLRDELKKKLTELKQWQAPDHLRQFSLNFGVSQKIKTEPGSTEAFAERVFADQQGEAWARVNSQRIEGAAYEGERRLRGGNYNPEGMIADMRRVEGLRNDQDLQQFFENVGDQKLMKLDAIGVLRKWSDFESSNPDPALKAKYEKLKQYYRVMNRFDYITNWTDINEAQKAINQKQELLAKGNNEEIRQQLRTNAKGTGDLTDVEFHKEAINMPKSRYVILDVVGMGNENVRSFEKVYLQINDRLKNEAGITTNNYEEIKNGTATDPEKSGQIMKIFQEESLKAGIDVTEKFKEKVSVAKQKIEAFYREKGYQGPLVSVPGGDEWTVAIPEQLIQDERQLQSTLFSIQKETNMRISVARKSAGDQPEDQIRAHKETLKNTETATEFTKKLEKINIQGVFFSQKENGAFTSVLNLPDGPRTIKDSDFIWPVVESLKQQGKSPITHEDIWHEYQRLIAPDIQRETVQQVAA